MNKFSIEQEMETFLKSKEIKSLFSSYKKAQDNESTESVFESEISEKFPTALLTLEKIGWADKFPLAYQELCKIHTEQGGKEDDFMLADDAGKFKKKFPQAYEALMASGLLEKFPDFFSDKIGGDDDILNQNVDHDLDVSDIGNSSISGLEGYASFDLAIDSLLTASASLDNLGFSKPSTDILKLASLIVEAKKKSEEKTKESKEDKKVKKNTDKDVKGKEDKKSDKKDKSSNKFPFPLNKKNENDDKKDNKDKKSLKDNLDKKKK